jgi:type I restriction enzyme S subunit
MAMNKIPNGYKQSEVGVIPEDWQEKTLASLGAFSKGQGIRKNEAASGTIPCIRYGEIYTHHNDIVRNYNSHISPEVAQTSRTLSKGDILFAGSGETKEEIGKAVAFVGDDEVYAGGDIIILSPRSECSEYFGYLLNSPVAVRQKASKGQGDAVVHISASALGTVVVPLPPLPEQRAIAEVLSDADALIESLEQLLAKKRQLKQGAMQALLTGKKRLPGFSGEWEAKRLEEIGSTFGGLTGKTKSDFGHGVARYITFMNIMTNVVIDCGTFEFVDVKPAESQNRVAKGDLFFNGSSETPEEVGMCAVLAQDVQGVFLNSFCFGFRFREGAPADGLYLAYYFRSREGRELLKSLAQGATRYNLSKTAFLKVSFPLPNLPEQTAIAGVLSDMDAEIAALEAKLAKTRQLKQGMMQELLTGRIRLV